MNGPGDTDSNNEEYSDVDTTVDLSDSEDDATSEEQTILYDSSVSTTDDGGSNERPATRTLSINTQRWEFIIVEPLLDGEIPGGDGIQREEEKVMIEE